VRTRRRDVSAVAALAVLVVVSAWAEGPGTNEIAVVVGRESFVRDISRDDLREIYLRRRRLWSNGTLAVPVNLPAGHPLRDGFSKKVLGRSVQDLVSYWNARYFEGIRPPIVLPSSAAVCAYVAAEPAAIGYVAAADADATCRIVLRFPG
jgi:ABC-type phosphate transport system substrate-binding protein